MPTPLIYRDFRISFFYGNTLPQGLISGGPDL
jgi:hypothetical protein